MRRIIFIFVVAFLSSCVTQKRCNERFPPVTSDSSYSVVSYECEYDTIYTPYKKVDFDTTLYFIPKNKVFHYSQNKNGLTSTIDINKGKLSVFCAADSLQLIIDHDKEIIHNYKLKKEVKYLPCDKKHVTSWYHFCFWVTWISIIILFLLLIATIIKMYLKG